jgi:uncharacterized protein (DUF2141 family)
MKRRKTHASLVKSFETLETRCLMTVTPDPGASFATAYNVGTLSGAHSFSDRVGPSDISDIYKFTMARGGKFYGRLRVYNAPASISLFQQSGSSILYVTTITANTSGPDAGYNSGNFEKLLTAGTYYATVDSEGTNTEYLARFTADYAGNSISSARDIGTALEDIHYDFVGNFDTPSLTDAADFYKVKMDADGKLWIDLVNESGYTDTNTFGSHFNLIKDANNSGSIDSGEIIATSPLSTVGTVIQNVSKGTYYIQVVPDKNYQNYRLRVNADYAPNSVGQFRDVTSSIGNGILAQDWIHQPIDRWDNYSFTLNEKRPFYMTFNETGGSAVVSLYRDGNGNNKLDSGELIESTTSGSTGTMIRGLSEGKYFVQVASPVGGGKYTLYMQAKADAVGNTLGGAKNLGTVDGLAKTQDEYITVSDMNDYYKFTASAKGSITATLNSWLGFDEALALIKDSNGNGSVDSGDTLVNTQGTLSRLDRITTNINAGTYFLRVYVTGPFNLRSPTAGRYSLSFFTDYAGNTQPTARDAGTLSGSKTYKDYATQNYGAGSDQHDYYKFKLSSSKTFSAKMVGELSGEDLDMQLYKDSNNNGKLDANEILSVSAKKNSPNESLSKSLGAGTYFLRVYGVNGDTNYSLTLKA